MSSPSILHGTEDALSVDAGSAETDEEFVKGISSNAHRRLSTAIRRQVSSDGRIRALAIDTKELDAALKADRAFAALRFEALSRSAHRTHKKAFFDNVKQSRSDWLRSSPIRHEGI